MVERERVSSHLFDGEYVDVGHRRLDSTKHYAALLHAAAATTSATAAATTTAVDASANATASTTARSTTWTTTTTSSASATTASVGVLAGKRIKVEVIVKSAYQFQSLS